MESFDAIVVGTGFAGAVTACRLAQAGQKICVLERGRRYGRDDFPQYPIDDLLVKDDVEPEQFSPPPDFSRWLWRRDHGLFDVRDLDAVVSVQAAGYGGGSLIYANVHLRPPREIFDERWPEPYRPTAEKWPLDDYFDLAAHMLQVTPVPQRLAKTLQLREAATVLDGSTANWFRTPLAISFAEPDGGFPDDGSGGRRESCDMRGRCCLGCDRQAKNTLDLNYLALAEKYGADVRTLAEVTTISRLTDHETFAVTYRDLVFRAEPGPRCRETTIRAKNVFLCAGAVATTELLMKNRRGTRVSPASLGAHYFPNADSLAAVFDCANAHEADYGPTITSAVRFEQEDESPFAYALDFIVNSRVLQPPVAGAEVIGSRSRARARLTCDPLLDWGSWEDGTAAGAFIFAGIEGEFAAGDELTIIWGVNQQATATARSKSVRQKHWFLIEDGGYPPTLEPLVGIFRSPLWIRRNRFVETETPERPISIRRPVRPRLRLQVIADAVTGRPSRPPLRRGGRGLFEGEQFRVAKLLDDQLATLLPPWFLEALKRDRTQWVASAAAAALPMLSRLLDQVATEIAGRLDDDAVSRLNLDRTLSTPLKREVLVRGMLRQALQILGGSEVAVANLAAEELMSRLPKTIPDLINALGDLLLWALDYQPIEGHTGVVLLLGRDIYRGRLDDRGGRLKATLPGRAVDTTGAMQERVLRAMARGWSGELRTNPTWTTFDKHVTVHSQGGCPMGDDSATSVTDRFGQVHGCEGLFVMDAAAFPVSVGVNPSATILAIAEYKIEHFIQRSQPGWKAPEKQQAIQWVEGRSRAAIDPLNQQTLTPSGTRALAEVPVLGLTFQERMSGLMAPATSSCDFEDLDVFPAFLGLFQKAENDRTRRTTIQLNLDARVEDLDRLIAANASVSPPKIRLDGKLTIGVPGDWWTPLDANDPGLELDGSKSFLQLFVRPPTEMEPPARFFRYRLIGRNDAFELNGLKVLQDGTGLDAWSDTSTLFFELRRDRGIEHGILRLSLVDFIQPELQDMLITGTSDAARRSWALGAFYRYFAREMAAVYGSPTQGLMRVLTGSVVAPNV